MGRKSFVRLKLHSSRCRILADAITCLGIAAWQGTQWRHFSVASH